MSEKDESTSVFDEANVSEELPTEAVSPDVAEEEQDFTPTVSSESPKERMARLGEKKEADGRVLTIKEVGFSKPKMKAQDGSPLPPEKTQEGDKEFYPGKLKVKFEEDNLVEYYPKFQYFVNEEGKVNMQAKIWREGNNTVSKLFKLAVPKMGKPADEISDQDFYDWLVGKKVKIKTESGTFNKKGWFRNDIVSFED